MIYLLKEHFFMHQVNLHMRDSGLMISFKAKAHCITKNHKYYLANLIIEILIKLESMYFEWILDIGPNMLDNFKMTIKKDKELSIYQMVINLKEILVRT